MRYLGLWLVLLSMLLAPASPAMAWFGQSKQIEELRQKAEAGDAEAAFRLGQRYDQGDGVRTDLAQAATWYRLAAEKGNVDAQNSLGSLYLDGAGVPKDFAQALDWFTKASAGGNVDAVVSLAYMYDMGFGVPEDNPKAVALYEQAADKGSVRAMLNLGATYAFGDKDIEKDQVRGYMWLEIARYLTLTSPDKTVKWRIRGALDKLKETMPADEQREGDKRASDWLQAHKAK